MPNEERQEDREKVLELLKSGHFDKNPYTQEHIEQVKANSQKNQELEAVNKKYDYIFNEEEVLKDTNFIWARLSNDKAGIGIYLPKNVTIQTKTGEFKTSQKHCPVIIYSNPNQKERGILPLNDNYENKEHKIRIRQIPDESVISRNWNLTNIQYYLAGLYNSPTFKEIFQEIKSNYEEYCSFENKTWYSIHALWDMATYFYLLFDYFAILELRGQMATGKTKIMGISRLHSFNPSKELTNPSESTLFREQGKTQYIDEAEKIFVQNPKTKQMEGDLRAEIINSGFKKTGNVPRQEKVGDKWVTRNYSTYAPRMIASINGLFGATEDRAIIHTTTPAKQNDLRAELEPNEKDFKYQKTRSKLHVLLLENWFNIERDYSCFNNQTKLKQRDLNIWKPILVLAQAIDKQVYEEIKGFAEMLSNIKRINKLDESSLEYWIIKLSLMQLEDSGSPLVLKEIPTGFPEQFSHIKPKTIAKRLESFGLYENKRKTNKGFVYDISLEDFKRKIELFQPDIFHSFHSFTSLNREKEVEKVVNESEQNEKKVNKNIADFDTKSEQKVSNEQSERDEKLPLVSYEDIGD